MCADRSVRYGWEKSPIDMCALLLRNRPNGYRPNGVTAIGNDAADLLRVTGGLDPTRMRILGKSDSFADFFR